MEQGLKKTVAPVRRPSACDRTMTTNLLPTPPLSLSLWTLQPYLVSPGPQFLIHFQSFAGNSYRINNLQSVQCSLHRSGATRSQTESPLVAWSDWRYSLSSETSCLCARSRAPQSFTLSFQKIRACFFCFEKLYGANEWRAKFNKKNVLHLTWIEIFPHLFFNSNHHAHWILEMRRSVRGSTNRWTEKIECAGTL